MRYAVNRGRQFLACVLLCLAMLSTPVRAADGLDLDAHRGKVVVVDFWASWCVPCRRSFPWMNEMHEKYRDDGLVIIGVNMDQVADEARSFLDEFPVQFDIVYDRDGAIAKAFDVIAMPSSYVFDREGNQVARHLGFKVRQRDDYEALLVETLAK